MPAATVRRLLCALAAVLVVGLLSPSGAAALALEEVGTYAAPTFVTSDPDDPDRIFVVERTGRIQLTEKGRTTTFLDIRSRVFSPPDDPNASNDHGLYSLAFSPDFATNGLFYVAYSSDDDPDTEARDESGEWHLAEFKADGDSADPASRREVFTIDYSPAQLHYGGQLQFGPDGYLYASTGDGGPQGDPEGNAQDPESLLGKLLRIDPNGSGPGDYTVPPDNPFAGPTPGADEIWSSGLRNPWRFSFDRQNGDLVIGDVGYASWEEINHETGSSPGKGLNFGWACREGMHEHSGDPPCDVPTAWRDPVFAYPHGPGACSVTGGYVVRDASLPDLYGRYVYADLCGGELRSLDLASPLADRPEGLRVSLPTSFGEDASGRLYMTSLLGPVYRVTSADPPADPPPSEPPSEPPPSGPPVSEPPASSPLAPLSQAPPLDGALGPSAPTAPQTRHYRRSRHRRPPGPSADAISRGPVVALTWSRQRLPVALARGVRLRAGMAQPGRVCATVQIGRRAARRIGLRLTRANRRHHRVVLAHRCQGFAAPSTRTLTLRFTRRATRALAKHARGRRGLTVVMRVIATEAAGHQRAISRRLRLAG